jgi:hypothetical protein
MRVFDDPPVADSASPSAQALLAPSHHVCRGNSPPHPVSWEKFYSLKSIWRRSRFIKSLRARLAFVLISKIYRQM